MTAPEEARIRVAAALARIEGGMNLIGASDLATSLGSGASEEQLSKAEQELGFRLPDALRALWSLHDGNEGERSWLEHRYLMSSRLAVMERDRLLVYVHWVREERKDWAAAGVTESEITSDRWLCMAGRDSDYLAISIESGRVFDAWKDVPALQLEAPSLEAYLERYAWQLENNKYEYPDGFGGRLARLDNNDALDLLAERFVSGLVEAKALALTDKLAAPYALIDRVAGFARTRRAAGTPLISPKFADELAELLIEQDAVDELFASNAEIRKIWSAALSIAQRAG